MLQSHHYSRAAKRLQSVFLAFRVQDQTPALLERRAYRDGSSIFLLSIKVLMDKSRSGEKMLMSRTVDFLWLDTSATHHWHRTFQNLDIHFFSNIFHSDRKMNLKWNSKHEEAKSNFQELKALNLTFIGHVWTVRQNKSVSFWTLSGTLFYR